MAAPSEPGGGAPLLEVDGVRVSFDTPAGPAVVVDGVSFALRRGEALGIVGESGSGKSVLVRSIMGIQSAAARVEGRGRVRFEGRAIDELPPAERRRLWGPEIAMVLQDPLTSLNPVRRVGVQITDPLRAHLGMGRRAARARAVELLEQVRVPEPGHRIDLFPHELSGGLRQRVALAVALSCEPKLLIADEPTTALDVTIQREILDMLQAVQRERRMAMILVSHDLGVVATRTDRVGVMYAGRLVESLPTAGMEGAVRHPYSRALLRSSPRLDGPPHAVLETIEGRLPDLTALPPGCRFAPRCGHRLEACSAVDPGLAEEAPGHLVACLNPVGAPGGDRLVGERR